MKRILELGLLLVLSSVPLFGAKNSYVFLLPADVHVGNVQLLKGHCSVTWSETSGSEVQLTIKTEDKKTITIAAREVEAPGRREGGARSVDHRRPPGGQRQGRRHQRCTSTYSPGSVRCSSC